jgi:type II restriction/modification system DNA methylase subunit YeeA
LFAEDFELLPRDIFTGIINECIKENLDSYDLIGGLFSQMNNPKQALGGRYKGVRYFNGGLFREIHPITLAKKELILLRKASEEDWSKIKPVIFGAIFQSSMGEKKRHKLGAHFTFEAEILKVVFATIVRPFKDRIENADTLDKLIKIRNDLTKIKVLDPACGSGNFLYLAYLSLKRIEFEIINKIIWISRH